MANKVSILITNSDGKHFELTNEKILPDLDGVTRLRAFYSVTTDKTLMGFIYESKRGE